jgi:hypothetical protein
MDIFWIAGAAFGGGIIAALLGWFDSGGFFQPKKFGASVIRALIAGVVFAIGYTFTNGLTPIDIAIAFLGGAGVDVLGNRASGALKGREVIWKSR